MNKTIFFIILSIILYQYICGEDPTEQPNCLDKQEDASITEQNQCDSFGVTSETKKCVLKSGGGCEEKDMVCTEKTSDATDSICALFHSTVNNGACINNEGSCEETNICNKVKEGATNALCLKLITNDEESPVCISDGKECKKTKECEEVVSDATQSICSKLNTNTKKCDLNSNKCVSIDYCNYAKGKDDEECNAFPVKENGYLCKKKPDGNNNECYEVSNTTPDNEEETMKGDEETKKGDEETKKGDQETKKIDSSNTTKSKNETKNNAKTLTLFLSYLSLLFLF